MITPKEAREIVDKRKGRVEEELAESLKLFSLENIGKVIEEASEKGQNFLKVTFEHEFLHTANDEVLERYRQEVSGSGHKCAIIGDGEKQSLVIIW
jgi:hypothetical protein